MVSCSLVDLVCWIVVACRACVRRNAGGASTWNPLERVDLPRCCNRLLNEFPKFGRVSMSMTMEQVVTQLQQELFTLRAQVAVASRFADAVRAINNLATAQVRKDTQSLIDVKGFGRPKEFTGREDDFQQWSKKTEAFFAGVIKESEEMLEWAAEQARKITTTAVDLEFLPTDMNEDRGVQNLEFCVAADAHSTHDSHEL